MNQKLWQVVELIKTRNGGHAHETKSVWIDYRDAMQELARCKRNALKIFHQQFRDYQEHMLQINNESDRLPKDTLHYPTYKLAYGGRIDQFEIRSVTLNKSHITGNGR